MTPSTSSSSSSLSSLPYATTDGTHPLSSSLHANLSASSYLNNTLSSSSFLSPLTSSFLPEAQSVTILDFPTPYYLNPLGSAKLFTLLRTLKNKVLPLRSGSIVPVYSVKLVEGNFGKGGRRAKRLCLLTGRVGRGERLRSVLRVCGRLEMSVAKDHLVQILAGLEVLRKDGITHDGG